VNKLLLTSSSSSVEHLKDIFHDVVKASNYDEMILKIKKLYKPKIIFLHFQSIEYIIDDLLSKLNQEFANINIVILTDSPNFNEGYGLLKYDIKAYANTYMNQVHYEQLVEMVENSKVWFYPEFMQGLISYTMSIDVENPLPTTQANKQSDVSLESLTQRENELVSFVVEGKSNKEIAAILSISESTVKQHLTKIYKKTGIADRLSLALKIKSINTKVL
jgi:DNA-binding NarL/FixJ family response regulator